MSPTRFPDLPPKVSLALVRDGATVIGEREARLRGAGGGGTTLTDECRDLLEWYRELRARLEEHLARQGQESPERASA